MTIRLFNTLGKKLETFTPHPPHTVTMYHCGPTVYNYAHIGNLRTYVWADTVRRTFEYAGYDTTQVINITDFGHLIADADEGEDKMTLALKREHKALTLEAMKELGDFYTTAFVEDLKKLNILLPHHLTKASDHIPEQIALVHTLIDKGFVYPTSDGLYFDTSKKADYGKLGNIDITALKEGARVETNPEKRNPIDFTVWKLNPNFGWDAPWGKGFPGWHIECSAMSMKYLGETFDIHTGGIDHIPVHHNNEIAQSESATGKPFVRYWMHSNFITIDNQRIAKSLQNDIYLCNIEERYISPLAYRYWLLTSHYQSQTNFTWAALGGARETLEKLLRFIAQEPQAIPRASLLSESIIAPLYTNFDTPSVIASIWDTIKNDSYTIGEKISAILEVDKVLGLNLKKEALEKTILPENIQQLGAERQKAREAKNWQLSDTLRDRLEEEGYTVEDGERDQKITKR